MNLLKFLGILLLGSIIAIGCGFWLIAQGSAALGHKVIGFATLFLFFVIMPLFIWSRYKNKDLSKFNFHQEKKEDKDDDHWDIQDKNQLN